MLDQRLMVLEGNERGCRQEQGSNEDLGLGLVSAAGHLEKNP